MNPQDMLDYFVTPALKHMAVLRPSMDSLAARQFMVAIAAQESHCGKYWTQLGGGPALSPWQIEPLTHKDLNHNYLSYRPSLALHLRELLPPVELASPLVSSPLYSAAVARLLIYRTPAPMPALHDRDGMWAIYKQYFNSYLGKATKQEWDHNWETYVAELRMGEFK